MTATRAATIAAVTLSLVLAACSSGGAPTASPSASPLPTDEMPTASYSPPVNAQVTESQYVILNNVQPDDGPQPVARFIDSARSSVDVSIYRIDSDFAPVVDALVAAHGRGLPVRISISRQLVGMPNPPEGNASQLQVKKELEKRGLSVELSRPDFHYGHEKSIIVDAGTPRARAMIADWNLQASYFGPSQYGPVGARGMAVVDSDPQDVATVAAYFDANWPPYDAYPVSERASLVWSPSGVEYSPVGNSVAALTGLMNSATKTLDVYAEYIEPTAFMLPILIDRAKAGVRVRVVANSDGQPPATVQQLRDAGVTIVFDPTNAIDPEAIMFVHSKTVIADGAEPGGTAFVGSQNQFLNESLEAILELGVLVTDQASVDTIQKTFDTDFDRSTPTQASPSPTASGSRSGSASPSPSASGAAPSPSSS